MLSQRFKYDKKPLLELNKLQLKYKRIVEKKVDLKKYSFERVNCVVCGKNNFELLSEKDRYGLYVSTVICKDCGLVQSNPRMNQKSYNEFYDKEYRKLYSSTNAPTEEFFQSQMWHGKSILNMIEKYKKKPFKNKFVVEIGAGAGGILQVFKTNGNKVFGVDLDSEYINFGQKKGLNLKVGTIIELKKINYTPDLVIYSHVLEHILDPVKELQQLRKYLKPISLVYIRLPGIKNLIKSYDQDFLYYLQNAHTYHFTLKSLKNIAAKAGFSIVYGNEEINSIFKIGDHNNTYDNDYNDTITFIRKLERLRISSFNLLKIRNKIFFLLKFFCEISGTSDFARKSYHSWKYRKLKDKF